MINDITQFTMFINSVITFFANKIIRPLFLRVLKFQPFTSQTLAFVFSRFSVYRFVVFDCSLFCSSAVRFVAFDRGLFGFYSSALRLFAAAFSLFCSSVIHFGFFAVQLFGCSSRFFAFRFFDRLLIGSSAIHFDFFRFRFFGQMLRRVRFDFSQFSSSVVRFGFCAVQFLGR